MLLAQPLATQWFLSSRFTRKAALAATLSFCFFVGLLSVPVRGATPSEDDGWPAVNAQELSLKDCPQDPGAAAMILYRQEASDDQSRVEDVYVRIKVFTEAGKGQGDIEIPYIPNLTNVQEIRGRTIHADGKVLDFDGQIYERDVVKLGRFRIHEKALALPDVEPGSIIEYAYRLQRLSDFPDVFSHPGNYVLKQPIAFRAAEWKLQGDLFTARAVFTIHPLRGHLLSWGRIGPPLAAIPQQQPDKSFRLEADDILPVVKEEDMPPEQRLITRFDFYYLLGFVRDAKDYWLGIARARGEALDRYIRENRNVRHEADQIVSPGDSDEVKARKIYARVQEIRNLSAEPGKTRKEEKKEGLKENNTISDVLKRGYSHGNEIDDVYVALARAAGLDADLVELGDRQSGGFQLNDLDLAQTDAEVLRVKIGKQDVFLDPASKFCPYGVLPWHESECEGFVPSSNHPELITIPAIASTQAVIRRDADLNLNESGELSGELKLSYVGEEAYLQRRLEENKDLTERRKDAEDEVKRWLNAGGTVKLTNQPAWDKTSDTLDLVFDIKIPSFALAQGRHLILAPAVFDAGQTYPFQALRRENPIDLRFPHELLDTIAIAIPPGFQIEALPEGRQVTRPYGSYTVACHRDGSRIVLTRHSVMSEATFPVEKYPDLHLFFDAMRTADQQQVLLEEVQNAQR